ncbi:MAG: stage 0 sporulation family protein [Thermodesulfobacteriota bacterium]
MKKVVGIRFKPAGKVYDFDCGAFVLKRGDHVIVETEQGLGFGTVIVSPVSREEGEFNRPLKKVFRLANENDFRQVEKNLETEKRAHEFCARSIKEFNLQMNLFSVESTFDGSKLTFFFTSEGRVDFRQLVKKLVKEFDARVEMRQVGIRNQAKMCGGIGRCGRKICCSTFIEKFDPVSIRMAKEQNLSLNPTKISGQCGRLMCCLTFEYDTYLALKEKFPKTNKSVTTKSTKGKVLRHNVICNRLTIRDEEGQEVEIGLKDIITVED